MLRQCNHLSDVKRQLAGEFQVTEATVQGWIALVWAMWRKQAEAQSPHNRDIARQNFIDFYNRAMRSDATEKGPDYKAALQALDRIARIDGCYEPLKVNIETTSAAGLQAKDLGDRMRALLANPAIQGQLRALGLAIGQQRVDNPDQVSESGSNGTATKPDGTCERNSGVEAQPDPDPTAEHAEESSTGAAPDSPTPGSSDQPG